jgi:hypothetical protein
MRCELDLLYTKQLAPYEISSLQTPSAARQFLLLPDSWFQREPPPEALIAAIQVFGDQMSSNPFTCNLVLPPLYHCQAGTLGWKIERERGTIPSQRCRIKMKRSPTVTVDQVSGTGDPVSGFTACRAWHEAIFANPPRERLTQTGERGGNRV